MSATLSKITRAYTNPTGKHKYIRYNTKERIANRRLFYEEKAKLLQEKEEKMRIEDPMSYRFYMNTKLLIKEMAKNMYGDGS